MSEPTLEEQIAALQARLYALDETARHGNASRPAAPQAQEQAFAEALRDVLNRSRTRWVGEHKPGDG
jgi:hypothetical protein